MIYLLVCLFCLSIVDILTYHISVLVVVIGILAGFYLSMNTIGVYSALCGLSVGFGLMALTGVIGNVLLNRYDTIGGGDVKLMAMCGTWLGVHNCFIVYFILLSLLILGGRLFKHKKSLPCAPFVFLAVLITVLLKK